MANLYNNIENLCKKRGVNVTTMCRDSGASRGSLSDLKSGRKQTLKYETLEKIANYFEISVESLVSGDERQKEKRQTRKPAVSMCFVRNRTQLRLCYHASSILSIIFSLLPIDVRQYGTRAAISTWHSRSTYRSKAILRSTLPSGALLMAAVICCRSSPCSAAGSTTRAAATGSTEPERLRQLPGVAHSNGHGTVMSHFAAVGKMVTHCGPQNRVRTLIIIIAWRLLVCSACHDVLLTAFAALLLPGQRKTESPCSWSPL